MAIVAVWLHSMLGENVCRVPRPLVRKRHDVVPSSKLPLLRRFPVVGRQGAGEACAVAVAVTVGTVVAVATSVAVAEPMDVVVGVAVGVDVVDLSLVPVGVSVAVDVTCVGVLLGVVVGDAVGEGVTVMRTSVAVGVGLMAGVAVAVGVGCPGTVNVSAARQEFA